MAIRALKYSARAPPPPCVRLFALPASMFGQAGNRRHSSAFPYHSRHLCAYLSAVYLLPRSSFYTHPPPPQPSSPRTVSISLGFFFFFCISYIISRASNASFYTSENSPANRAAAPCSINTERLLILFVSLSFSFPPKPTRRPFFSIGQRLHTRTHAHLIYGYIRE